MHRPGSLARRSLDARSLVPRSLALRSAALRSLALRSADARPLDARSAAGTSRGRRSRALVAAASLLLLASAAGCSSGDATDGPTPVPALSVLASLNATMAPTFGPWPVLASVPPGARVLPWKLVRVDAERHRVFVAVTDEDCAPGFGAVVHESSAQVSITVVADVPGSTAGSTAPASTSATASVCEGKASMVLGFVQLSAPLGTRELVHGAD